MPTMFVAAICSKCSEIRARSTFTFQRGEPIKSPLKAEDFAPVGDQPVPTDGQPMTCYSCNGALTLRPMAEHTINSNPAVEATPVAVSPKGLSVLFAAEPGEEVSQMRDLSPDRILIITNKRIVHVDINRLIEEG